MAQKNAAAIPMECGGIAVKSGQDIAPLVYPATGVGASTALFSGGLSAVPCLLGAMEKAFMIWLSNSSEVSCK